MAALSFLRALNFLSPVMVSCLCIVDATLSRFYRERERVRGWGWCEGGGEKTDELWSIEGRVGKEEGEGYVEEEMEKGEGEIG